MTSRERWTVYPLLFLAIGLAVRSAIVADEDRAQSNKFSIRIETESHSAAVRSF
jgi:hypothetical protein